MGNEKESMSKIDIDLRECTSWDWTLKKKKKKKKKNHSNKNLPLQHIYSGLCIHSLFGDVKKTSLSPK